MTRFGRRLAAFALLGTISAATAAQEPGEWARRVAELDGRLYILGGYPANRDTVTTVQVYDIATDKWEMGPDLPSPNNHGMAASVGGKVYLIGGQTEASGETYVDTVYELDPAVGMCVEKAADADTAFRGHSPRPRRTHLCRGRTTAARPRVRGLRPAGRPWERLPDLPSQRNHIAGGVIDGRIHVIGGRLGGGFRSPQSAAHEVFDPKAGTWSVAAHMPRPRSGINGVVADGCLHAWAAKLAAGIFPDHDYYDPRADHWTSLDTMPLPVHGVTGSAFVNGLIHAPGGGTEVGGSSGSLRNQVYRPAVSCLTGQQPE